MEKNNNYGYQLTKQIRTNIKSQQQTQNNQAKHGIDMKKLVQNYEFWLGNIIAKNKHSQVYSGIQKTSQKPAAIKVIPIQKSFTSKQRHDLENQIKLCKQLPKHPNLVNILDIYSTTNNYYIMMQHCMMDLKTLLIKKKHLSQEQVIRLMLDIVQGIKCLYTNGYIHCNIKPSNILIGKDGKVRLTDWAMMRKVGNNGSNGNNGSGNNGNNGNGNNNANTDPKPDYQPNQWTPYMSPLTLITKTFNDNNDTWSLVVLMYQCLHGYQKYPWNFQLYNDLLQKIYQGNIQFSRRVSKEMVEFLTRYLNPKNNVSIFDMCNDPFIKRQLQIKRRKSTGDNNTNQVVGKQSKQFKSKSKSKQRQRQMTPTLGVNINFNTNTNTNINNDPANNNTKTISIPNIPLILKKVISGNQTIGYNDGGNDGVNNFYYHHAHNKLQGLQYQPQYSPNKGKYINNLPTNINPNPTLLKPPSIKQLLDCQLAFMRFINIILKQDEKGYIEPIPDSKYIQIQQKRQLDHKLFRFVLIKQDLIQKHNLKQTFSTYHPQNPFNLSSLQLQQFLQQKHNKHDIQAFKKILAQYDKKYQHLENEMEKLKVDLEEKLTKLTKCQWRPKDILTTQLKRKQIIPILGIRLARQHCKHLWHDIQLSLSILSNQNPNQNSSSEQHYKNRLISQIQQKMLRIDFLMTYYQLNCLLIDDYENVEGFYKQCGLHIIMNNVPMRIGMQQLGLIEEKLRRLEMV